MTTKKLSNLICIIIGILVINSASANLMIAPQRLVFEERERSASVNLINTSSATTTYRLRWVQKKQAANSRYINLPPDSNEVANATPMLRFSPRQVTLAPGEKQTVRIALRRKKDLNKGEYRSHLLFQALPNKGIESANQKNAKIKINLLLGFAIPVIVRQGKLNGEAKITDLQIEKSESKGKIFYGARVTIKRKGIHTTYGTLKVLWKPRLVATYKQIAILNNVALYPESSSVQYYTGLKDFKPNNGYMKIIYEGRQEYNGKTFDTLETQINKNKIVATKPD